jgi:hypothetical protein
MFKKTSLILLTVLLLLATGCKLPATQAELPVELQQRMQLVEEIKAFERDLGLKETDNFKIYSDQLESYDYFFYTPYTDLPYSLDDPSLLCSQGKPENYNLAGYDVFYYSIQAIAGVKTPITASLMQAPISRFIHVVFHEDWHEQIDMTKGIEEPSAEIFSYNAALLFAEEKYGRDSVVYRTLEEEYSSKLRVSTVYQHYYDKLADLYQQYHSAEITEADTLSGKAKLIEAMGSELEEIWGVRPDQLNNAYIAFQMTYFRHFPLMQQLFVASGYNLPKTIAVFRAMPDQGASFKSVDELNNIETEVVNYLTENIASLENSSLQPAV